MGQAALAREFAKQPPREPLDSLGALWRDYMWRYVKAGRQDPCVYWTKKAPNLHEAIRRACASLGEDGKMFFHQSKVRRVNRIALCRKLWQDEGALEFAIERKEFWSLFGIVKYNADLTPGIGAVTTYDVASRIGSWADLEPEHLYFHAGVLMGLKALGVTPQRGTFCIEPEKLPKALRNKNMDLVESFLCGYRSEIERVMGDG